MTMKHEVVCDKCGKTAKAEARMIASITSPRCIDLDCPGREYKPPKGWREHALGKHLCNNCVKIDQENTQMRQTEQ